jgi:hypothetical protein
MTDWWQPTFQTTIDAYYDGRLAEGLAACEALLSVAGLPAEIELQTHRNLAFYAPPLAELAPGVHAQRLEIPVRPGWSCFNPSIAADPAGDGFRMIVRSSNYAYDGSVMRMSVVDGDPVIRTENVLLELDGDLAVRTSIPIDDLALRVEPPPFPVAGFEDCRLVSLDGMWWATATVRDRSQQGVCQTALFRLEGAVATDLRLLSDGQTRHEKNWMPVAGASPLRFVYTPAPTILLRFDEGASAVVPEFIQPAPLIARRFSGGAQVVPHDGGHLGLIHEAARFDDGNRLYLHRWVWFDAEWRLARLSPPFVFHDRGVEFAAGLARRGDDLIISYGVWDREAWLATVPASHVESLLAPPLDPDAVEAELRAAALTAPLPAHGAGCPLGGGWGEGSRVDTTTPQSAQPVFSPESPPFDGVTPFLGEHSLVSTTITANSRDIIGDALASVVDWVDLALVIDTGVTDDTLEVARDVAGDKLVVRPFPWRDDFSAARNFALETAAELGAAWAVTLDTDERIRPGALDLRAALAAAEHDSLHVRQADGTYGKERFFRLPVRGRYVGPTHEAFIRERGDAHTLDGIVFEELSKSPEQYREKAERDVAILSRHIAEHPDDPRWFYYLGDSLAGLDRREEAVAAFRLCWELKGWDEEGAWAMYRAAKCLLELDRPDDAIEACALGLARHAGLAELSWLAAYGSWQAGRPAQAAYWAHQSVAMGQFAGSGAMVPRIGFRHPPALWEGPYDVLRFALRAIGEPEAADEAERLYQKARAARERQ